MGNSRASSPTSAGHLRLGLFPWRTGAFSLQNHLAALLERARSFRKAFKFGGGKRRSLAVSEEELSISSPRGPEPLEAQPLRPEGFGVPTEAVLSFSEAPPRPRQELREPGPSPSPPGRCSGPGRPRGSCCPSLRLTCPGRAGQERQQRQQRHRGRAGCQAPDRLAPRSGLPSRAAPPPAASPEDPAGPAPRRAPGALPAAAAAAALSTRAGRAAAEAGQSRQAPPSEPPPRRPACGIPRPGAEAERGSAKGCGPVEVRAGFPGGATLGSAAPWRRRIGWPGPSDAPVPPSPEMGRPLPGAPPAPRLGPLPSNGPQPGRAKRGRLCGNAQPSRCRCHG